MLSLHFTNPLSVDGGTDFETLDCFSLRDDERDHSALAPVEVASATRFTDPFSVDGGSDSEAQDCLQPRDCGLDSALTHQELTSTPRFTGPLSVDGGTDSEALDCLPPTDRERIDSALTPRFTDLLSVNGGTDYEPQGCSPSRDCGVEDLSPALKDLAPLWAPLLRREPHPRESGSEGESLAQEVWLLPPPRVFLPLTIPAGRVASTDHLYPFSIELAWARRHALPLCQPKLTTVRGVDFGKEATE